LCYNDEAGVQQTLAEIMRVLRPGGALLCTFNRPDDALVAGARQVAPHTYVVSEKVVTQAGAVLFVPTDEAHVHELFAAAREVEIGSWHWEFNGTRASSWIVWAVKPS
jgi:hypothetical protein